MNDILKLLKDIHLKVKGLINSPEEKPFPNEHACRLEDPKKFDRFRRQNNAVQSNGKRLDFIFGIKGIKSKLQSIRYPQNKWNAVDARKHCVSRNGTFEAAKKE